MKTFVVLCTVIALCWAKNGHVVRPKDDEGGEATPAKAQLCPQDEWDGVKSIREYNNWTTDTLPYIEGFTVMLIQFTSTVGWRCYGTEISTQNTTKIVMKNIYPAQLSSSMAFDFGEREESSAGEPSKQLMIAGASSNFIAYAMCNGNSSYINLFVTYKNTITENEKRAINKWIKSSNLPMLGKWAAINFDTCSLTKTYLCNGGQDKFCSTTLRRAKKVRKHSSEESSEDGTEGLIFIPW
ncbi:uncharacterized protein LOC111272833 [Varroa jacobsoni]|uniref:uncharacterized protein LOC111272833 n=1 Tax=Varroa jacobsoni TaxID=62625 RepID=UPI000BF333A3|nr:uncharacterized protein LOC111272833 [Varroa jacobsoni]